MIGSGFISFILFTSNPFQRLSPTPPEGLGLNPLLQDPGLALHPPMLYLGYVGFSMAFSFAVAALIEGKVDSSWAKWIKPWTLAAWTFLTLGIGLGSWWAYYELGWGGWWYWDPVENASFIPWLTGTALIHSMTVLEKREALKRWTILLAIVTFSLSLLGTFLVRSGVLTSVHAFASDPTRGVFILILLSLTIGCSLFLYAIKAPSLEQNSLFAPISREGGLLVNNLFLATAATTILIGTLYPLFAETLGQGKISVGAPYFNTVFVPLMIPLFIIMGLGPFLAWRKSELKPILSRLKLSLILAIATFLLSVFLSGPNLKDLLGSGGVALGVWLIISNITEWSSRIGIFKFDFMRILNRAKNLSRTYYGMLIAHIGIGILIIGVTGSSTWKQEKIVEVAPGENIELAETVIYFEGASILNRSNYESLTGSFTIDINGNKFQLNPERRIYNQPVQQTTEASIYSRFWYDIYLVIGEGPDQDGKYVVRAFFEPFVPFIWYGIILMGLGGTLSLTGHYSLQSKKDYYNS